MGRYGSKKYLLRKYCVKNEMYMDDLYILCNYETIFPHSFRHFQHTLPTLSKTLYTNAHQKARSITFTQLPIHQTVGNAQLNYLRQKPIFKIIAMSY